MSVAFRSGSHSSSSFTSRSISLSDLMLASDKVLSFQGWKICRDLRPVVADAKDRKSISDLARATIGRAHPEPRRAGDCGHDDRQFSRFFSRWAHPGVLFQTRDPAVRWNTKYRSKLKMRNERSQSSAFGFFTAGWRIWK